MEAAVLFVLFVLTGRNKRSLLALHIVPIKTPLTLCISALQVGFICVRVPATCGSTEVCTDLPVRGKTASTS